MTYGIEIKNDSGGVVFNSNDPVMMATEKGTLSMSLNFTSSNTVSNEAGTSWFSYSTTAHRGELPMPSAGEWLFFEIPVAERRVHAVHSSNNKLYVHSNISTVRWVKAVLASQIVDSASGYGMRTYDSSGNLTWSSAAPLIALKGTLEDTTVDANWFAFSRHFCVPSNSNPMLHVRGIKRESTGFAKQHWRYASYYGSSPDYRQQNLSKIIHGFCADIDFDNLNV